MARCAYIIAAWAGPRRGQAEPRDWLSRHLEVLDATPHGDLDVVVVVPACDISSPGWQELILSLPGRGVRVLRRENSGLSYGSFSYAYGELRAELDVDYWIFMEDDWVSLEPGFDARLMDMFERGGDTGYLCGLAMSGSPGSPRQYHAAISVGITSGAAVARVWDKRGVIPHTPTKGFKQYYQQGGQVKWGRAWMDVGYRLRDVTEYGWGALFWCSKNRLEVFFPDRPSFFTPIQGIGLDVSRAKIRTKGLTERIRCR